MASGLPGRIANMIFDMYAADRHIKVHGAVAGPRIGHRGLIAGCAFAKDILKAFLIQPLQQCPTERPRDCVDDIALQITEAEPGLCAIRMEDAPRDLTAAQAGEHGKQREARP